MTIPIILLIGALIFWRWSHAAQSQIHATARFVVACVMLSWAIVATGIHWVVGYVG